jgi:hypothetical protein
MIPLPAPVRHGRRYAGLWFRVSATPTLGWRRGTKDMADSFQQPFGICLPFPSEQINVMQGVERPAGANI